MQSVDFEERVEDVSPHGLTDAALEKSQALLDHILSLGLLDEDPSPASLAAALESNEQQVFGEGRLDEPATWGLPGARRGTAEVPVEFLRMLAEMWQHLKAQRAEQASASSLRQAHSAPALDAAKMEHPSPHSPASTHLPSSSTSLGGSMQCSPKSRNSPPSGVNSVMSAEEKAQLVRELREVLSASLPHQRSALSPAIGIFSSSSSGAHLVARPKSTTPQPMTPVSPLASGYPSPAVLSRGVSQVAPWPVHQMSAPMAPVVPSAAVVPIAAAPPPSVPSGHLPVRGHMHSHMSGRPLHGHVAAATAASRQMAWKSVAVTSIHHFLTEPS